MRDAVGRHLEQARKAGAVGSALDAEVDLYCSDGLLRSLSSLGDELRFVLITSYARLHPLGEAVEDAVKTELEGLKLLVSPSDHDKCVRCWHHRHDVGAHPDHPRLCGRCVANVTGEGEVRRYA